MKQYIDTAKEGPFGSKDNIQNLKLADIDYWCLLWEILKNATSLMPPCSTLKEMDTF